MTRARRLLYATVTTVLLLGAAEGTARLVEAWWLPYRRSLPIPAPTPNEENTGLSAEIRRLQKEMERGAIPLAADPVLGWSLQPNEVRPQGDGEIRTNSAGLRGGELTAKPAGTTRLMSLGDSSIFGHGVGEKRIFLTVAAATLTEAWGRPVEAVHGAVPGHTAPQSLETLRTFGGLVAPDWVVVGNLWSDLYGGIHGVRDTNHLPASDTLRRLALYRVTWQLLGPAFAAQKVRWLEGRADVGSLDGEGTPTRTSLADYFDALRKIVALARSLGARPIFLALCAPMDFDPVPPPETVTAFRAAMQKVASEAGAPYVDAPAAFRASGANVGYFDDQVHPNNLGHALLGELVARAIQDAEGAGPFATGPGGKGATPP